LPEGWEWHRLGDVVELTRKPRNLDSVSEIPFVTMRHISEQSFALPTWEMRPSADVRSGTYFEADDVLLARITPCFENGKLAVAPEIPNGWGYATTEVYAMRSGRLRSEYLAYCLKTHDVRGPLLRSMEGATGRMRVPKEALEALPIPVPPLEEQGWIVQRIEDLLVRISQGVEILGATSEALHTLRRSVLKTSFPSSPEALPPADATGFIPLADLCLAVVDCEHKTAPRDPEGQAFSIGTGNLRNGRMLLDQAKRVSDETYAAWSRRMTLRHRDIVLAREAPVGEVGIVPAGVKACLGQRTVLLRPDETKIQAEYLLFQFQAPELRSQMTRLSGGSTVEHLNVGDIRTLRIPSPPSLGEQRRIVGRLETRMREIQNGFAALEHLNGLAGGLTRSVLRMALTSEVSSARADRSQPSEG
jgi:type I restriction enzyme S subunit